MTTSLEKDKLILPPFGTRNVKQFFPVGPCSRRNPDLRAPIAQAPARPLVDSGPRIVYKAVAARGSGATL